MDTKKPAVPEGRTQGPNVGFELQHESAFERLESYIERSDMFDSQKRRLRNLLGDCSESVRNDIRRSLEHPRLDSLTGLLNQKTFLEEAARHFRQGRRSHDHDHGKHLSLGMVDIRSLKFVNDTFDHLAGTELIKTVARVLRKELRGADLLARYGGDEFCFFLTAGAERSIAIATRVKWAVDASTYELGKKYGWSEGAENGHAGRVDIGLACVEKEGSPLSATDANLVLKDLLRHADELMYASKSSAKAGEGDEVTVAHFKLGDGALKADSMVLT